MRKFIVNKIEEERKLELLGELNSLIEELPAATVGTALKLVREDRGNLSKCDI